MSRLPTFHLIPPSGWLFQDIRLIASKISIASDYRKANKSLRNAEYDIEEFIRQWALQQLVITYDYPDEWIGDLIVVEELIHIGSGRYRADIAVKNRNGDPLILIETKKASCSSKDFHHAEQQLKSYLAATHSALFGMVTDGYRTTFIKKRNSPNTFEIITDLPSFGEMLEKGIINQTDTLINPIDETIQKGSASNPAAAEGLAYPSIKEYIRAFKAIEPYMSSNQRMMLETHFNMPEHTLTMTELARSVGFSSYRGGNLQYGRLGQLLCDELNWRNGVAISVLVWFTPPDESPHGQWLLTLHEEVVEALKKLKWFC